MLLICGVWAVSRNISGPLFGGREGGGLCAGINGKLCTIAPTENEHKRRPLNLTERSNSCVPPGYASPIRPNPLTAMYSGSVTVGFHGCTAPRWYLRRKGNDDNYAGAE